MTGMSEGLCDEEVSGGVVLGQLRSVVKSCECLLVAGVWSGLVSGLRAVKIVCLVLSIHCLHQI